MSIARKLRRKDVIPQSTQKKLMAAGQRRGVVSMMDNTEKKLKEAYQVGFEEASTKAHISMTICALAVLHDKFDFGHIKAKRFADELCELTDSVNKGYVSIADLVEMLVQERFKFLQEITIEDGKANKITVNVEDL